MGSWLRHQAELDWWLGHSPPASFSPVHEGETATSDRYGSGNAVLKDNSQRRAEIGDGVGESAVPEKWGPLQGAGGGACCTPPSCKCGLTFWSPL